MRMAGVSHKDRDEASGRITRDPFRSLLMLFENLLGAGRQLAGRFFLFFTAPGGRR
jgi:hypothetical protein